MPGSADNATLLKIFGYLEMPATMQQLEDNVHPGNMDMVSRVIYTRLGKGVIKDGDAFWISEEVLTEGIAYWEEDLKKTQRYLDYLKAQRDKLALRENGQNKLAAPIRLTASGWWKQIDDLQKEGKLPDELGCLLKGLIGSYLSKTIPPAATPNLIKIAKKHLQGWIELSDSAMDHLFDVMVYTPNPGQEEGHRNFFVLIRKYPEGKLKYLDEL